jgi:hypothetical protein
MIDSPVVHRLWREKRTVNVRACAADMGLAAIAITSGAFG